MMEIIILLTAAFVLNPSWSFPIYKNLSQSLESSEPDKALLSDKIPNFNDDWQVRPSADLLLALTDELSRIDGGTEKFRSYHKRNKPYKNKHSLNNNKANGEEDRSEGKLHEEAEEGSGGEDEEKQNEETEDEVNDETGNRLNEEAKDKMDKETKDELNQEDEGGLKEEPKVKEDNVYPKDMDPMEIILESFRKQTKENNNLT